MTTTLTHVLRDAAAARLDRRLDLLGQLRAGEIGRGVPEVEAAPVLRAHGFERTAEIRCLRRDALVPGKTVVRRLDRPRDLRAVEVARDPADRRLYADRGVGAAHRQVPPGQADRGDHHAPPRQHGLFNHHGIDLGDGLLGGAQLEGANLSGANLRGANLWGADLYQANLFCADLSGAYAYEALFIETNVSRVNFTNADLTGAETSNGLPATLWTSTGAIWSNTTCPDGTVTNTGC